MDNIKNKIKSKKSLVGYLFIAPLIIYFLIFQLVPMVMALVISFNDWNMRSDMIFVGLSNYIELFTDQVKYPFFYHSLWITLKYILIGVPLSVLLCLIVSALLTCGIKGERFFKTLFYIPSVTTGVAITAMWMFMLDPTFGMINQLLGTEINFLGNSNTALLTLIVMSLWGGLGYNTLIMVSAMKNIDKSLYESSEMDGAGAIRKFFHITIPQAMPTIFFIVITGIIGGSQVFEQVYLMTGGGPEFSTYTFMFGIYNEAFEFDNYGVASAMSYVLFIIILIVTFIQFKVLPQDLNGERRFNLFYKKRVK